MILSDVLNQGLYFGVSIFCGLVCGIFYDVFYVIRKMTDAGKILTFLCDMIFAVLSVLTIFYIIYITNGFDFKWYMIMGIYVGFSLERLNFKKPVAYVTEKVYNGFVKLYKYFLNFKIFKKFTNNREEKADDRKTAL